MQLLIDAAEQHEHYVEPEVERYPVIDPARPFVCQKCGVSFAREKALLSHSRVSCLMNIYVNLLWSFLHLHMTQMLQFPAGFHFLAM